MAKTLTICSWLLVALGVLVTMGYFPYDSAWLPLGLLPYVFFALAARAARRLATRAVVLSLRLTSVCIGFWFFWDAMVRPSTLSLIALEVVIAEALMAGMTWLAVWRVERLKHAYSMV